MSRVTIVLAIVVCGALAPSAASGSEAAQSEPLVLDLPLFEAPFNTREGAFPGMSQSLTLSRDLCLAAHAVLDRRLGHGRPAVALLAKSAFDLASLWLPGGQGWLHEEWHRAALSRRGIRSRNSVYRFSGAIVVDHVRDEDLAALKRDSPAELVRAHAAGAEAQQALALALQKEAFYSRAPRRCLTTIWLARLSASVYLALSPGRLLNDGTRRIAEKEGPDVTRRDFTGIDFSSWVYDLHRPDEPYAARGVHPSGVGVDRYRLFGGLSPEEQRHLRREARLTFLNLADPQLLGLGGLTLGGGAGREPLTLAVSLGHGLTSFGNTLEARLLARRDRVNLYVALQRFSNQEAAFPGLELELRDLPAGIGGRRLELTPRLLLWRQPVGQSFRTRAARGGGLAAVKLRWAFGQRLSSWLELEGKTEGWVAGTPYLNRDLALRAGLGVEVLR